MNDKNDLPMPTQRNTETDLADKTFPRGMYKNVKVPVKLLNIGIIVGIAALICVTIFLSVKGSYSVTFEVSGGTSVASQSLKYGKSLSLPDPPKRTGYAFSGWYRDKDFTKPWVFDNDVVESSITLYAKWTADTP